jgi:hypothetical protein
MDNCPKAGNGVNSWINKRVIFLLSRGVEPIEIVTIVRHETANCGRDTLQDIYHSLETAPNNTKNTSNMMRQLTHVNTEHRNFNKEEKDRWPALNDDLLLTILGLPEFTECTVDWWRSKSEQTTSTNEEVLHYMMGGNNLVCVAHEKHSFCTAKLNEILKNTKLSEWQYIVANPMYREWGRTKSGRLSMRCLDNVGSRWYCIVEFDSGTLDEQCACHRYLSDLMPLKLLVFSGGKSIHGWYDVYDLEESESKKFMNKAVSIGADSALWILCQLTRIPGGTNSKTDAKQEIIYFHN